MKKFLSLLGASLLLGISTASAATVSFSFTGVPDANDYVEVSAYGDDTLPATITSNTLTIDFDDYVEIYMVPENCTLDFTFQGMQLDAFSSYLDGSFTFEYDIWDIILLASDISQLGGYPFNVTITPTDGSGEAGGDGTVDGSSGEPLNASISFYSTDYDFWMPDGNDTIPLYPDYITITTSTTTGSIPSNLEANEYGTIEFTYTPTVSLSFEPKEGYIIESILIWDEDSEDVSSNDYISLIQPGNPEGIWSITISNGAPDYLTIMPCINPYDGALSPSPTPGEEKTVTLEVVKGNYELVNGYYGINGAGLTNRFGGERPQMPEALLSFNYTSKMNFQIWPGDEVSINITCADPNVEEGVNYTLTTNGQEGSDLIIYLTLDENTPDDITFNITVGDDESNTPDDDSLNVSFLLNLPSGVSPANALTIIYDGENMDPTTGSVNLTSSVVNFPCNPAITFDVTPADGYVVTDIVCAADGVSVGQDLTSAEGTWTVTVEDPEENSVMVSITIESLNPVVNPNVTLNFTGEGLVEGLTVDYQDWDNSANDDTYTPNVNPFIFEVSATATTFFRVEAEGYVVTVTLAEDDAQYANDVDAVENGAQLNPHTMDLTFDVNVMTEAGPATVTFEFAGAYTEGLVKVVESTTEQPITVTDSEFNYTFTNQASFIFEVPEAEGDAHYELLFTCDGVEEGQSTFIVENPGDLEKYYVDVYPGVAGKTILVSVVDEYTGISGIYADEDVVIYTLQGVRVNNNVNNLTKGIYIINGKKVSVK